MRKPAGIEGALDHSLAMDFEDAQGRWDMGDV
jgi:hypothetical protein